jgi:membrane protein
MPEKSKTSTILKPKDAANREAASSVTSQPKKRSWRNIYRQKPHGKNILDFGLGKFGQSVWDSIRYYAVGLYNYIDEDHVFFLSAGIAFNVLYCIVPLTLVTFYFVSTLVSSDQRANEVVLNYVAQALPLPVYKEDLVKWLASKLTYVKHSGGIAGLIGVFSLIWLASILFSTLRTSLNAIFGMRPKSNYFLQKALDIVLMIIVIVLLFATTFISPLISILGDIGDNFLPRAIIDIFNSTTPFFIGVGVSILLYVILFRMLPHQRLSRKVIFVSASTTVLLIEVMKYAFSYYMRHLSSIGTLYGTYAFLVGVSLWIYYVSAAFLIGAEMGWLYRERNELTHVKHPTSTHPGEQATTTDAVKAYDEVKLNPTQPAGIVKQNIAEDGAANPASDNQQVS